MHHPPKENDIDDTRFLYTKKNPKHTIRPLLITARQSERFGQKVRRVPQVHTQNRRRVYRIDNLLFSYTVTKPMPPAKALYSRVTVPKRPYCRPPHRPSRTSFFFFFYTSTHAHIYRRRRKASVSIRKNQTKEKKNSSGFKHHTARQSNRS